MKGKANPRKAHSSGWMPIRTKRKHRPASQLIANQLSARLIYSPSLNKMIWTLDKLP